MPNTTKEAPTIRLFLAPINRPVTGEWFDVPVDHTESIIRSQMNQVKLDTSVEELRISDAEGLPSSLIPQYGGVPVQKIAGFVRLANKHGLPAARAFLDVLSLLGITSSLPPDEWRDAFARSHAGVQDSRTAWAEVRVTSGIYPHLMKVAQERGIGYINLDRVRSNMEHDPHTTFIDASDGVHLFYVEEI